MDGFGWGAEWRLPGERCLNRIFVRGDAAARSEHTQVNGSTNWPGGKVTMFDIDETIDAFRRGALDIDCKRMVLAQHKEGGECFEGQGYIRQADGGALIFKIYVATHNAKPLGHLAAMFSGGAGKLYGDE